LFIDTGKYKVLVDTGAGSLGQNTGKLLKNLKLEGVSPEDINVVILTHAHPDHIGGNINAEGKPVFSKAKWIMWKDEWLFWTSEQAERLLDKHSQEILINIARMNLLPLQRQIDLVDKEIEIIPGIHVITAPGHTPGLMALSVTSEEDQLLCISDAAIHPIHLAEPEWFAATDVFPDKVYATRNKLLSRAVLEKSLVMAFHFPFPGLGYILQKDKGWQWQPIKEKVK
jgi:glyoxylase-like metal-dependent hydrolase (beta-lactamase superfamily II)